MAGQTGQRVVSPVASENVPGWQCIQSLTVTAPCVSRKVPAGQGVVNDTAAPQKLPAGHGRHWDEELAAVIGL